MARWTVLWVALVPIGCGPTYDEEMIGALRHVTAALRAGGDGTATLKLHVESGETAFLATAFAESPYAAHHRELRGPRPDEQVLFDAFVEAEADVSKTNAGFISTAATLNWPILAMDRPLEEARWDLDVGVTEGEAYAKGDVVVEVLLKQDDDFSTGAVHVNVVFAGDTADDPDHVDAVEQAVARWTELYLTFGLDLFVAYDTWPNGALGPPAFDNPDDYRGISAMTPVATVNLVIAPDITGFEDVYGISGDIPGPLLPSERSAVLVSLLDSAGADNRFSDTEIRILSETFAHETGHFLGLYHPVEIEYQHWDAVEDTPECTSELRCFSRLSDNLMFPFPVCSFALESCTPQTVVTEGQAAVVHRNVAVD